MLTIGQSNRYQHLMLTLPVSVFYFFLPNLTLLQRLSYPLVTLAGGLLPDLDLLLGDSLNKLNKTALIVFLLLGSSIGLHLFYKTILVSKLLTQFLLILLLPLLLTLLLKKLKVKAHHRNSPYHNPLFWVSLLFLFRSYSVLSGESWCILSGICLHLVVDYSGTLLKNICRFSVSWVDLGNLIAFLTAQFTFLYINHFIYTHSRFLAPCFYWIGFL